MTIQSTLDQANGLVDQATHAVEGAIASTQQTANHAVEGIADQVHRASDEVGPMLAEAAEQASAIARRGAESAREASRQIQARAEALSTSTAQYIQEQPLRSVLIAAATGAVAAAMVALLRAPRSRR